MVIWINGPFGVGKTQVAFELHTRLPGSFIIDPEEIGFLIRKLSPREQHKPDFQDEPLWREMTGKLLLQTANAFKHPVIVPMTLVNPDYFREIIGFLRQHEVTVHHIALIASRHTLIGRLKRRGDGANSWAADQIDRCLTGLVQLHPEDILDTDNLSISRVAEQIAKRHDLRLLPSKTMLQKQLFRMRVQWQHIRC